MVSTLAGTPSLTALTLGDVLAGARAGRAQALTAFKMLKDFGEDTRKEVAKQFPRGVKPSTAAEKKLSGVKDFTNFVSTRIDDELKHTILSICSKADQVLESLDRELIEQHKGLGKRFKRRHPRPSIKTIKCATASQFVAAAYGCEWLLVPVREARAELRFIAKARPGG